MTGIAHFGAVQRGFDVQHGVDRSVARQILIDQVPIVNKDLSELLHEVKQHATISVDRLQHTLYRAAGLLIQLPKVDAEMIRNIVRIPVQIFSPDSLHIGTAVWDWIVVERPDFEKLLMVEMLSMWNWCQRHRKGLYSPVLKYVYEIFDVLYLHMYINFWIYKYQASLCQQNDLHTIRQSYSSNQL